MNTGPNERRCISRHALGFYRALIISGIYTVSESTSTETAFQSFGNTLRHCVAVHPILSAAIAGEETESSRFIRPAVLDLQNHAELIAVNDIANLPRDANEKDILEYALTQIHDKGFSACDRIPPWKIVVLPLSSSSDGQPRFFVAFSFSHSHGDGKSGLAFHKTLLQGLRSSNGTASKDSSFECRTPSMPLLPTIEKAGNLSISWSYLLGPLLGAYLPKAISQPLNIRASTTPEAEDQWRAKRNSYDPQNFRTGAEILSVDHSTMSRVLTVCKQHNTKFTGLLHQLIVRALSESLPADIQAGTFVAQTAVDLRRHLKGITSDDMAMCPTGHYELHTRATRAQPAADGAEDPMWAGARKTTESLVERGSSLADQPIGLLHYLSNVRAWLQGNIGKLRDSSYELSNLLSFDPGVTVGEKGWNVEKMVFSQPANATGGCVAFNLVTRRGGDMVLVLSWQRGILDVPDEKAFAAAVCGVIGELLQEIAGQ